MDESYDSVTESLIRQDGDFLIRFVIRDLPLERTRLGFVIRIRPWVSFDSIRDSWFVQIVTKIWFVIRDSAKLKLNYDSRFVIRPNWNLIMIRDSCFGSI